MYTIYMKKRKFRQRPYRRGSLDATAAGPWLRLGAAVALFVALVLVLVLVVIPAAGDWAQNGPPWRRNAPMAETVTPPPGMATPPAAAMPAVQRFAFDAQTGCAEIADPVMGEDGTLLFAAGAAAPVYDRLFRLDLASGVLEQVEATPVHDTFRYPVESGAFLAVFDARAGGGGEIRALDKRSGRWASVREVPQGTPVLRLEGRFLVWTEQDGAGRSALWACDLDAMTVTAVATFDTDLFGASLPCVTDGRVVYADGTAADGVIHSAWLEGDGLPSSFHTGGPTRDPQGLGAHWAWLSGAPGERADLYLSMDSQVPLCIAHGVERYTLLQDAVVYGCDALVFCYRMADGRTYLLSGAGERAEFVCAGAGYAVWRDLDGGARDVLEYVSLD